MVKAMVYDIKIMGDMRRSKALYYGMELKSLTYFNCTLGAKDLHPTKHT